MLHCFLFLHFFFASADVVTFPRKTLQFSNGVKLDVEVATTYQQKAQGLMLREKLPEGQGMIFIFPYEQTLSFWMKNTLIPLTIGYFDKNRVLIETHDMEPALGPVQDEMLPRYPSARPAMYAVEVPKGWFTKKKINPKASFKIL